MDRLRALKSEMETPPIWSVFCRNIYYARGFSAHMTDENVIARAYALKALLEQHEKYVYDNDSIAGSIRGLLSNDPALLEEQSHADEIVASFGFRGFLTNADHFAPDYEELLHKGVGGILTAIQTSMRQHAEDTDFAQKQAFLRAAEICMKAFQTMIRQYGDAAAAKGKNDVAAACYAVEERPPQSFQEALQLVWLTHVSFCYEGRYAMALGRLDQYLYPYFCHDRDRGILTAEQAQALCECTLYKIHESCYYAGDDVVNIAIGGVKPADGTDATNELSYCILRAVGRCNIPGPNLSARLHKNTDPAFVDACLQVVGSGLGYPAMMNDEVNIPALRRYGYALEDCRDYCMVGCIENFLPGKQPPWSDGRYNTPKYLELALNNGRCMLTGKRRGPQTGDAADFSTMDQLLHALEEQMRYGAAEYVMRFRNENDRFHPQNYQQPYLSCFCKGCVERAMDINAGGALYPSVHGVGVMGIGTVADSLAAVEKVVYNDHVCTLSQLCDALRANFEGWDDLRQLLLAAPKYGNNQDFVDKYAAWFVEFQSNLFKPYRTRDGGGLYIAIASNTANIDAGAEVAATPDGRLNSEPLSDAASPMHGMDRRGPTAALLSLCKPDYTLAACGTVVNQKYSPEMLLDADKRTKMVCLVMTYFQKGGQELQINSVSREVLLEAMQCPEKYANLVVRVSGFSAYYTRLSRKVQLDILKRTQHATTQ